MAVSATTAASILPSSALSTANGSLDNGSGEPFNVEFALKFIR